MGFLEEAQKAAIEHLRELEAVGKKRIAQKEQRDLEKEGRDLIQREANNPEELKQWLDDYMSLSERIKANIEKLKA